MFVISFSTFFLHLLPRGGELLELLNINSSLKFEIMAKQLYVASQRVL